VEAHVTNGELQCIGNWLSDEKQRVVLNGQLLDCRDDPSGVPLKLITNTV